MESFQAHKCGLILWGTAFMMCPLIRTLHYMRQPSPSGDMFKLWLYLSAGICPSAVSGGDEVTEAQLGQAAAGVLSCGNAWRRSAPFLVVFMVSSE